MAKLLMWSKPLTAIEPVYKSLFEVDFKDDYMNSIEAVTKFEIENNKAKFTFNDNIEIELKKMQEYFGKVKEISIKQHDKSGEVFRKIAINVKGYYDLQFSLSYSETELSTFSFSVDCDYEFTDTVAYKMNKKFGL